MTSNAEIVEQIRRVLDEPEGFRLEDYQRLASEYASACERFNDALSLAIRYYSTGFYCEAVRIAREENFADGFERLLFDRADEWREHCRNLGCEIGPNVSTDNGVRLLTFLIKYEQHERLFIQNRLLALANAGAAERLNTLYQLASAFPENTNNWADSIEQLEKRRNLEIQQYLNQLNAQNASLSVVRELLAELESPVRRTLPPPDVLARLRKAEQFLFDRECKEELSELAQDWHDAETEKSEEDALDYLKQYRSFSEQHGETKTDEYFNALTEEEQNFLTSACRYAEEIERRNDLENEVKISAFKLENALNSGRSEEVVSSALERLELTTVAAGRSTLPPIGEVARGYIDDLKQKKRRRTIVYIVLLSIVLGTFARAVGIVSYQSITKRKALGLAHDISKALDDYDRTQLESDLQYAGKLISAIKPKYVEITKDEEESRNLKQLQGRYTITSMTRDAVSENIKTLFSDVENSHSKGLPNPNAIEQLGKLVNTIEDRQRYGRLKREDSSLALQTAEQATKNFNEKLAELTKEFSDINDNNNISRDDRLVKTNALKSRLSTFDQSFPRLSQPQRTQIDALTAKIDAYQNALKETRATEILIKKAGSSDEYKEQLERIGRQLNGKENKQIQNALNSVALVNSVERWNEFAEKYADYALTGVPSDQFESFAEEVEKNDSEFMLIPEYIGVKEYCQKKRQDQNDQKFVEALDKLSSELENKNFDGPYYQLYHVYNERYYYLDKDVQYGDDLTVNYQSSNTDVEKKVFNASFMDMEDVCVQAIQYTIYEEATNLRNKNDLTEDGFRAFVKDTIQRLVETDTKNLDPVVKGILLGKVTRIISEVPGFATFKGWSDKLNEAVGDKEIDIYSQDETNYIDAKPRILEALEQTKPELSSKLEALDNVDDSLAFPTYQWIGFIEFFGENASLERGEDENQPSNAKLYVAKSKTDMVECGSISGGKARLNELDASFRWLPVYAKINP